MSKVNDDGLEPDLRTALDHINDIPDSYSTPPIDCGLPIDDNLPENTEPPQNADGDLVNLFAVEKDGATLVPWANLCDAVKSALRAHLNGDVTWFGKLMSSRSKSRHHQRGMSLHEEIGKTVVCKPCAFQHKFCIKKWNDNQIGLNTLCILDLAQTSPTLADVEYVCMPVVASYAPSKNADV